VLKTWFVETCHHEQIAARGVKVRWPSFSPCPLPPAPSRRPAAASNGAPTGRFRRTAPTQPNRQASLAQRTPARSSAGGRGGPPVHTHSTQRQRSARTHAAALQTHTRQPERNPLRITFEERSSAAQRHHLVEANRGENAETPNNAIAHGRFSATPVRAASSGLGAMALGP
jgi:hypothetical protein